MSRSHSMMDGAGLCLLSERKNVKMRTSCSIVKKGGGRDENLDL